MEPVTDLRGLPFVRRRTVIINCGTELVTTLALASAIANADAPVLLINCGSNDTSREHFARLAARHDMRFDYLEWPVRSHGATLDAVFRDIPAEAVLLLDSDLELRGPRLYGELQGALAAEPAAYGSGFLHGPQWLGQTNGLPPFTGYYAARMWIPCTLLRTDPLRAVLLAGATFSARSTYFEIPRFPRLSRLASYRFRVRGLRLLKISLPIDASAPRIDERRPRFVNYDTGADLHGRLVLEGARFAALPESLWRDVEHYHGTTRETLVHPFLRAARRLRLIDTGEDPDPSAVQRTVRSRLRDAYGIDAT